MIYKSKNPFETQKIASNLAKKIINSDQKILGRTAVVLGLEGELGAGKTTFVKGFAHRLGAGNIKSPTFILIKKYSIKAQNSHFKYLYHLDCYRLKDHKDLIPLGIKDMTREPHSIVLIEWSDRVKKILPKKYIKIHIDHINKNKRKLEITEHRL